MYLARDLRLNRRVAVKVLHPHYTNDPDFLKRFRHEAQAAAILSHPNVVDVYDVGQDGDIQYIVMEFVDGTDLKKLITSEAPLAIDRAVAIAEAVAHGLEAAHRLGMVHRDIKPQNIIVDTQGHVRITDFGIAKSQFSTANTETGITFGTVDYLSPEQAQGQSATPRSDIYSLGVTLYEMLTGRLPFSGENTFSVAMQHVSAAPTPPRQFNAQIPPQLENLMLRALAKEPAQRPESAQEFARLLHNYRNLSQQETLYNPYLARRLPVDQAQTRPATQGSAGSNVTARNSMPPPRSKAAQAPRQQGFGCGVLVVGMVVLAGVLGLLMLFSTGALDGLFAVGQTSARPGVTASAPTALPTPSPTPTAVPKVLVPNLVNLQEDAAQNLLRSANLLPVTTTANNDTVAKGVVIAQEPAPQTQLEPGKPVTFTVSLGPSLVPIELPDLTRRTLDLARRQAEQLKLAITVVEEPSQTVAEGFVIRQSPEPGLLVQPGYTVTLVVSIGDKVRFPDVVGRMRAEAEATLRTADGLTLVYVDEQGRDRLIDFDRFLPGEVVSALANGQPVRNGQFIPRGSEIVLGVRGP